MYGIPFEKFGQIINITPLRINLNKINGYDLIVFTGGHDVHPSLYNQEHHITTISNLTRDKAEKSVFNYAKKEGIPMVGICRGSQFLTVMNGGSLIQNVQKHSRNHFIYTKDSETFNVTSTHHQMMIPKRERGNYSLIAWTRGLSSFYEGDGIIENRKMKGEVWPNLEKVEGSNKCCKEPEVVWYEKNKCLAVQYHPEYMHHDSLGFTYFQKLVSNFIFRKENLL